MDKSALHFVMSATGSNVIPSYRKVRTPGALSQDTFYNGGGIVNDPVGSYDPANISPANAAGGYEMVVQIASRHCLRLLTRQLGNSTHFQVSDRGIQEFLATRAEPFESDYLNSLRSRSLTNMLFDFQIHFQPTNIQFTAPARVCITLQATLNVSAMQVSYIPDPVDIFGKQAPQDLMYRASLGRDAFYQDVINPERRAGPGVSTPGIDLFQSHRIAMFPIRLCCDYAAELDQNLKRVDVFAHLRHAEFSAEIGSADALAVLDTFLSGGSSGLRRHVVTSHRAHLTPTISLIGTGVASEAISEIGDFTGEVFHVGSLSHQALAIALSLRPGAHGLADDVEHFIGNFDYGVISDEYLVEKVLMYKWRIGGFQRVLNLSVPARIRRGNHDEDAQLEGTLRFESLNTVSITPEANSRTDCVKLGGMSVTTPLRFRLADGTIIEGDDLAHLGDVRPQRRDWTMYTNLSVGPDWSPNPELREFQRRASEDAYQHIARPFANSRPWTAPIQFASIEGVTKMVLCLGNLTETFI